MLGLGIEIARCTDHRIWTIVRHCAAEMGTSRVFKVGPLVESIVASDILCKHWWPGSPDLQTLGMLDEVTRSCAKSWSTWTNEYLLVK
jgi:hypothetical protein